LIDLTYIISIFPIFWTCSKCWLILLASSSYAFGRCSLFWSESFMESLSLHLILNKFGLPNFLVTFSFLFYFILLIFQWSSCISMSDLHYMLWYLRRGGPEGCCDIYTTCCFMDVPSKPEFWKGSDISVLLEGNWQLFLQMVEIRPEIHAQNSRD
jgi:hypothetical protein